MAITGSGGGGGFRPGGFSGGGGGGFSGGGGGGRFNRFRRDQTPPKHRINDMIRVPEVRVIADDGAQLGVISTREAISIAEQRGLDLVEVSAEAKPPVCRLMDYGKFKYKEQKKEAEARKRRTEVELKELRIRYRTDSGDLETKLRQAREFLVDGNKVKFSMRFKGREIAYVNLGIEMFNQIVDRLKDVAMVDERSRAEGKQMHIVLAPAAMKVFAPGAKPAVKAANKPAGVVKPTGTGNSASASISASKPAGSAIPSPITKTEKTESPAATPAAGLPSVEKTNA